MFPTPNNYGIWRPENPKDEFSLEQKQIIRFLLIIAFAGCTYLAPLAGMVFGSIASLLFALLVIVVVTDFFMAPME